MALARRNYRHPQLSFSDVVTLGNCVEVAGSKEEPDRFMPFVTTRLQFDRRLGLNRAPIRFESHEHNHNQYRRTLIGVIYGSQIAMKGITLACKNKWRFLSSSFSSASFLFLTMKTINQG